MATKDFESVKAMVTALQPSYPVYCLRPEIIAQTAKRFLDLFPGRVLYAVKCNPHPEVLKALQQRIAARCRPIDRGHQLGQAPEK